MTAVDTTRETLRTAIDWHLALAEGDSERWHAFTRWLEADASHRRAYEQVALEDAALDAPRPVPVAAVVRLAPPPQRGWLAPLGWAAGIAALAIGVTLLPRLAARPAAQRVTIATGTAATRDLVLADGTRVSLNRSSRLGYDRAAPRLVTLESGEAMFDVRHDAAHPFRVVAAGRMIEDVGTRFDVTADRTTLRIAVAEGKVVFDPQGQHIGLDAGMSLRGDAAEIVLRREPPAMIGGWRRGRLHFIDAALADVAGDLGRATGVSLGIAPALAGRRFSGVVDSRQGAAPAIRSLAALAGVTARQAGSRWLLVPDGPGAG